MAEYIEREAVLKAIDEYFHTTNPDGEEQIDVLKSRRIIRTFPAADVEVVKHGRWEQLPDNEEWAYCSQCHCCWEWEIINNCNVRYCPNCGAKMDLEVTNGLDQH